MPKLIPCRDCGGYIARSSRVCIHCGSLSRSNLIAYLQILSIMGGVGLFFVLYFAFN